MCCRDKKKRSFLGLNGKIRQPFYGKHAKPILSSLYKALVFAFLSAAHLCTSQLSLTVYFDEQNKYSNISLQSRTDDLFQHFSPNDLLYSYLRLIKQAIVPTGDYCIASIWRKKTVALSVRQNKTTAIYWRWESSLTFVLCASPLCAHKFRGYFSFEFQRLNGQHISKNFVWRPYFFCLNKQ